ncbi:MAG: hypothetical protein ACREXR_16010, partial [Gammaproteobacteria bacterium]
MEPSFHRHQEHKKEAAAKNKKLLFYLLPAFAFLGPFYYALTGLGTAYFRAETLTLAAAIIVISTLVGLWLQLAGERFRTLILAVILASFLDLVLGGRKLVGALAIMGSNAAVNVSINLIVLALGLAFVYWILWLCRTHAVA